jgi:UDP-galactopyranose mutase
LKYREEAARLQNLIIAGRLGDYKYYDMHQTIGKALYFFDEITEGRLGKRTTDSN